MEMRQEIFEQLLPEETFVDRRLMTEAIHRNDEMTALRIVEMFFSLFYCF